MRNLILVAHISLDGFVAGTRGELDGFDASEENLQFVCSLTRNADTAVLGRKSYQLLNGYWPTAATLQNATPAQIEYSNWYNSALKIVVSKTLKAQETKHTRIIDKNIAGEIGDIKKQPGGNLLLFGSPSVCRVLTEARLVDEYWIFVNPVIFGDGIPLFTTMAKKVPLKVISTRPFLNGELAILYQPDYTKS